MMHDHEHLELQHQLWQTLDQILLQVFRVQMQAVGYVRTTTGSAHPTSDPEVLPAYAKWMNHTLHVLQRYAETRPLEASSVWSEWDAYKENSAKHPEMRARVELADVMIRALPHILTGKQPVTEVMFPGGSMTRVEGIYKHNAIADHFNSLLGDEVVERIRQSMTEENRKVRILEIGAGTGGTSYTLFQKLEPYREFIQEYCYTDISKSFLQYAKKQYGPDYPYLTYSLLNIEEPIKPQGVEAGQFDLVVATNVLHATRQIRQTLQNAKALLTLKGELLINEIIEDSLFNHVTFGLLSGWWLYEDEQVRIPGTPLLRPESWKAVLEMEGYLDVQFPASHVAVLGQQIIRAVSDGMVRQKYALSTTANQVEPTLEKNTDPTVEKVMTNLSAPAADIANKNSVADDTALKQACKIYLQKTIGAILDVEPEQIDPAETLEMYGLDSILIIQLTEQLNKEMGEHVSSVLFFEYTTLDELADYFVESRRHELISMLGFEESQDLILEPDVVQSTILNERLLPTNSKMEVAIIGLAGRYAQADDMSEFWNNLKQGRHCITEIPSQRWDWRSHYHSAKGQPGTSYSQWGGFIRGIYQFDPLFFHISPKEAEQIDPQERQFLQTVYWAIEDAGYTPESLANTGKVSVYAGVMNGNYPTGASFWSVANRVSYTFNFTGPSLAVDTACSSSLTAIHLAMESLRSGTSHVAIAGGVNLILDPVHYVRLSEKTMLSPGDKCSPFGEGADGFVDGEGVGALLLKPLHLAEDDGDFIYGILKGSSINTAGKTKGYTVPSPAQQEQVISEALSTSGVDARTISYIEAHGTGTALGDPIEIEGLRRAFEKYTTERQFCAIGSLKSNIGHAESAAGIAGISKILLQMHHGCLVPSLHAERSNPNINFSQTPFRVQKQMSTWARPVLDTPKGMREYPRIAGISSFGAGGANAHVIIEEYRTEHEMNPSLDSPEHTNEEVIIILSAKTKDRLRIKVQQLEQAIQDNAYTDVHLTRIAYTLQTGREEMEYRCAFTASTIQEMTSKLQTYLTEEMETAHHQLFVGDTDSGWNDNRFEDDDDMQELAVRWMRKRKTVRLMENWVRGMKLDWMLWYGETVKPRRISLPGYPFAEEHYRITPMTEATTEKSSLDMTSHISQSHSRNLHPLLHRNTSHLGNQRFSSIFTGHESFLRDHQVRGVKILPGAAHLEMVAAALRHSLPLEQEHRETGRSPVRLRNLVWMHPASVKDQSLSMDLLLHDEQHHQGYKFEITSHSWADTTSTSILFSQGFISLINTAVDSTLFHPDDWHERHRNGKQQVSPEHSYRLFSQIGLHYGSTHRCITHLYIAQHSIMARLEFPTSDASDLEEYELHPSLLDSAFQACLALAMDLSKKEAVSQAPWLPYALHQAEIYRSCTSVMWVEVTYASGSGPEHSTPQYDVALYREDGLLSARFNGLALRNSLASISDQREEIDEQATFTIESTNPFHPLQSTASWTEDQILSPSAATSEHKTNLTLLAPMWVPLEPPTNFENFSVTNSDQPGNRPLSTLLICSEQTPMNVASLAENVSRQLVLPERVSVSQLSDMLAIEGHWDHLIWLCSSNEVGNHRIGAIGEENANHVTELTRFFRLIKSILHLGYGSKNLQLSVVTKLSQAMASDDTINPDQAAIHGLAGSLAKEYAHWSIQVIDWDGYNIPSLKNLQDMSPDRNHNTYVWRDEEWYRQELVPVEYDSVTQSSYKQRGVYMIIGGAGGIGEVWTRYMISTYQAQIIWLGRSSLTHEIRHKIEQLGRFGPEPVYIQADASLPGHLEQTYESVVTRFGQVNGIIHSALVLSDRSVARMHEDELNRVLAAKVQISEEINRLMHRMRKLPDFVMFFSSLNSFMKLPGQSNYVAACCYADALASQMNRQWPGRVKVINWGYWGSVGSVVSEQVKQSMQQKGIGSIEAEEVHPILEWLISSSLPQAVIFKMTRKSEILLLNENQMLTVYR